MKKLLNGVVAASMLLGSAAFAQGPAANPGNAPANGAAAGGSMNEADCKLSDINASLDSAIAAIKASPAYGHAGGHYAKAERDLNAVKKQLDTGCKAWMKGGEKTGKKAK